MEQARVISAVRAESTTTAQAITKATAQKQTEQTATAQAQATATSQAIQITKTAQALAMAQAKNIATVQALEVATTAQALKAIATAKVIEATMTAQALEATATAQALEATMTAQALATERARVTATARAERTATAEAQRIATVQAQIPPSPTPTKQNQLRTMNFEGTLSGQIAPHQEEWFTFEGRDDAIIFFMFTPNVNSGAPGQIEFFLSRELDQLTNFGAGSIPSPDRDSNPSTGELSWGGSLHNGVWYYVRFVNGSNHIINYCIAFEDLFDEGCWRN